MAFESQGTESTISKSTAGSSKESKRSKKLSKTKKENEPDRSEDESETELRHFPSNFLPQLIHANKVYLETWKDKDESMNPAQRPYLEMIQAEKTREVEDEIRMVVDHELRGKLIYEEIYLKLNILLKQISI